MTDPLEELWDDLLSREQDQIESAFDTLTQEEQDAVIAHLRDMVNEPEYDPEQRTSALAALDALDPDNPDHYEP